MHKCKYLLDFVVAGFCSKTYCASKINRIAGKYKDMDTKMCGNVIWGVGLREIVPVSVFERSTELMFEGELFPAPIGYDCWLTTRYGNYMQLPPESERIGHNRVDYLIEYSE